MPAVLLAFGLVASWMDYELDLANDLRRNLAEVTARTEASGAHLLAVARQGLLRGDLNALRQDFHEWSDEPWLRLAAVVDGEGGILASSDVGVGGQHVRETSAAPAWELVKRGGGKVVEAADFSQGDAVVLGAFPIQSATGDLKWLLLVYDRVNAVALAHRTALRQAIRSISVLLFFCLCVWAVLHFGVAARLERLSRSAREFGQGRAKDIAVIGGGDEVHELSLALGEMGRHLADRDRRQRELECQLIESTECERLRIGHELHDGIGQQLTGILMATSGLHRELSAGAPDIAEKVECLSGQLRETIKEVRGISHGLAPVPLWERGIQDALQSLADSTTAISGVRCVFECPPFMTGINESTAGNFYRIAQEAVNNALKHACPGEIRIGLEQCDGRCVIEVEDDGCGPSETMLEDGGIGLRMMRLRAEIMGGNLVISAAPAGGTRIAVDIPQCP